MQRSSLVDIIPPQLPPHFCDNASSPLVPTPSRLEGLQKKTSGKWYSTKRFSASRNSQQHRHYKPDTLTISPYANGEEKDVALSPTSSSSTHLPDSGYCKTEEMKRSRSFAYGSQQIKTSIMPNITLKKTAVKVSVESTTVGARSTTTSVVPPIIYPALLSRIACELQRNMMALDHFKHGIEYKNSFTGQEAVDHLSRILSTNDRFLALMVGRALGSQRFFHDVSYENRLVDSVEELYQFEENASYFNKASNASNSMHLNKNKNSNDNNILGSTLHHHDDCSLQPCDSPTATQSPGATTASNSSVNESLAILQLDPAQFEQCTMAIPNGIITELTYCYAPTCRGPSPCYSYSCPKRQSTKRQVMALYNNQLLSPKNHTHWADLVGESEYNAISLKERKRQEGIYELIYTEANYIKDLDYLDEMWIQPLTETDIIPESRRTSFVDTVFSNIASIYAVNVRLLAALLARQKERLVVHAIGDIMLDFVVDFEPYIEYCARQHAAKNALEHERYVSSRFDWFINDTERHPSSQKLELNGYLTKPTTRLGKYLLLLNEILKRTPEDHPDHVAIPKAIAIIKQFLTRMNTQAGRAKNRFDLARMHESLEFKNKADVVDLGLLKESRVIIKQGGLRKTPNSDSTEYQVILLDHYLVVAKVKMGRDGALKYVVQKRPMALDLLTVFVPKEFKEYVSPSNHSNSQRQSVISSTSSNSENNENGSNYTKNDYEKTSKRNSTGPLYQKHPSSILPYVNVNNTSSPMMLRPFNDPSYYSSSHQSNSNNSNNKPVTFSMTPSTVIHERERKIGYPIVFDYLGRRSHNDILILYATSNATRKPWVDKIMKQQSERRQRNKPKFNIVSAVEPGHFDLSTRINHMITFNNGQQYLLATDDGVFVGHMTGKKKPHRILNLPKVTQLQVVESAQMLLILSDRILWDYGLDVVNGKPESQPLGKRVRSHVPFFYVGQSLQRLLVCVPRVSALKSTISAFEPVGNGLVKNNTDVNRDGNEGDARLTTNGLNGSIDSGVSNGNGNSEKGGSAPKLSMEYHRRKTTGLLDRMAQLRMGSQIQSDVRLKHLKDFYVPSEVWAIELSPSKMLITTSRGIIMVDMKTDQPQQLLDPADKHLAFVTDREREDSSHIRQPLKHIAIFRTPRGDHFVCYDEYGFYIDGKGNRLYPKFLVEWEGNPEAFAYQYPYVIAFEPSFIEIRHIITGELEQIIRGSHIRCLNNGHKTDKAQIFGVLSDEYRQQSSIFEITLPANHQSTSSPSSSSSPSH